jgi:hypothetical protein
MIMYHLITILNAIQLFKSNYLMGKHKLFDQNRDDRTNNISIRLLIKLNRSIIDINTGKEKNCCECKRRNLNTVNEKKFFENIRVKKDFRKSIIVIRYAKICKRE